MMNGGLSDLRIVKPRDGWPNPKAVAAASGAGSVIETARIYESTAEAVGDLQRVYAMTARPRDVQPRAQSSAGPSSRSSSICESCTVPCTSRSSNRAVAASAHCACRTGSVDMP